MSKADALIRTADRLLRRVSPADLVVYKRVITRTGGDDLIGRPGSVTFTDTLLDPQPTFANMGRGGATAIGPHDNPKSVLKGSARKTLDDYKLVFSVTAITASELANPNLQLVAKDSSGNAEVWEIIDFNATAGYGKAILFNVFVRSVKRP